MNSRSNLSRRLFLPLMYGASSLLLALAESACAPVPRESAAANGSGAAGGFAIEPLDSRVRASLRGLDVVDDRVAWASGSEGHVGVSRDGGATWRFQRVAGYEERDFRDVEAFSARRALVMAVGSPGIILETEDGGATWTERFRDGRPEVFLDALECIDLERSRAAAWFAPFVKPTTLCLAFGDPIGGRFLLLRSDDGGRSWTEIEGPEAIPGEAAFAASGTALAFRRRGGSGIAATVSRAIGLDKTHRGAHEVDVEIAIGTGGGEQARVMTSIDLARRFTPEAVPLAAGAPSRGVYSLVWDGSGGFVAVGGDHLDEDETNGTAAVQLWGRSRPPEDPGPPEKWRDWAVLPTAPAGYRSGVERLADGRVIATGPNGTDLLDLFHGPWLPIAAEGFHAVSRAEDGDLVLLAGADGRIARLVTAAPRR